MTPRSSRFQQRSFMVLLVAVSLVFAWILRPFFASLFWAGVLALVFAPLHRRILERLNGRSNLAALASLLIILVGVILPVIGVGMSLFHEGSLLYAKWAKGEINLGRAFEQVVAILPQWVADWLDRAGLDSFNELRKRIGESMAAGGQAIAARVLSIGQNTFQVVVGLVLMLYMLFFFLRDGRELVRRVALAVPLSVMHKRHLFGKFATAVRATVKGTVSVAVVQGTLGGLIFWVLGVQSPLLWGVVMVFLSLIPAVGSGLVWGPVALYFLATGDMVKGSVLIAFGVLVIAMVDNVLRPILVGKDTRMPDYLVLISTLGGLTVFGLNGFVIGPLTAALFLAVWDLFIDLGASAPRNEAHSHDPKSS